MKWIKLTGYIKRDLNNTFFVSVCKKEKLSLFCVKKAIMEYKNECVGKGSLFISEITTGPYFDDQGDYSLFLKEYKFKNEV